MSIYQYSLSSIGWSFFFLLTLRRTAHCLNPWQGWNESSEIMPSAVSTIPFQRYRGGQVTNEGGKMQFNILLLYYIDYRCIHMIHIWFPGVPVALKFGASCSDFGRWCIQLDPRWSQASYAYINTTSNDFLGRTWQAHGPMRTVETCWNISNISRAILHFYGKMKVFMPKCNLQPFQLAFCWLLLDHFCTDMWISRLDLGIARCCTTRPAQLQESLKPRMFAWLRSHRKLKGCLIRWSIGKKCDFSQLRRIHSHVKLGMWMLNWWPYQFSYSFSFPPFFHQFP